MNPPHLVPVSPEEWLRQRAAPQPSPVKTTYAIGGIDGLFGRRQEEVEVWDGKTLTWRPTNIRLKYPRKAFGAIAVHHSLWTRNALNTAHVDLAVHSW